MSVTIPPTAAAAAAIPPTEAPTEEVTSDNQTGEGQITVSPRVAAPDPMAPDRDGPETPRLEIPADDDPSFYSLLDILSQIGIELRRSALDAWGSKLQLVSSLGKAAAEDAFKKGLAQGIAQIVGGAVQVGFAGGAICSLKNGPKITKDATEADKILAGERHQSSQMWSMVGQGLSGISTGSGGTGAAFFEQDQIEHQTEKEKAQTELGYLQELRTGFSDLLRSIRDNLNAAGEAELRAFIV